MDAPLDMRALKITAREAHDRQQFLFTSVWVAAECGAPFGCTKTQLEVVRVTARGDGALSVRRGGDR